jgi:hypothetical protein
MAALYKRSDTHLKLVSIKGIKRMSQMVRIIEILQSCKCEARAFVLSWGHWELVNLGDGAILPSGLGALRLKEWYEAADSILVEMKQ